MRYRVIDAAMAMTSTSVLLALAGWLGVTRALGAHPYWAQQVVWIGIAIGGAVFVLSRLWHRHRWMKLALAAVLLGLSYAVAEEGKARFAASFAEDFMAGRMWYFGWMAVVAFAFVLLAILTARRA